VTARVAALAALALLPFGGATTPQQGTRFRSTAEAVRVDVLVTRDGQPVPGLTALDFDLFDNGVRQAVQFVASEEIPLNVVMALDVSASVKGERLDDLRRASHAILGRLAPLDSAALVAFGQDVAIPASLTHDISRVRRVLDALEPMGETSLVDAVHTAMLVGETQPGRALVLLFTDGVDALSYLQPDTVLDIARRAEVVVYAVVTRSPLKSHFLEGVTRTTGGGLFEIESTHDLDSAFAKVFDEFRHRYVVSYSPRAVAAGGWHSLQVKVKRPRTNVKARSGYRRD
jgi:VWFA-related protein